MAIQYKFKKEEILSLIPRVSSDTLFPEEEEVFSSAGPASLPARFDPPKNGAPATGKGLASPEDMEHGKHPSLVQGSGDFPGPEDGKRR